MLNVIWSIFGGTWLALGPAVGTTVMVIGIPLALAVLKLIPVSLVPLGVETVPVDSPGRLDRVHI